MLSSPGNSSLPVVVGRRAGALACALAFALAFSLGRRTISGGGGGGNGCGGGGGGGAGAGTGSGAASSGSGAMCIAKMPVRNCCRSRNCCVARAVGGCSIMFLSESTLYCPSLQLYKLACPAVEGRRWKMKEATLTNTANRQQP